MLSKNQETLSAVKFDNDVKVIENCTFHWMPQIICQMTVVSLMPCPSMDLKYFGPYWSTIEYQSFWTDQICFGLVQKNFQSNQNNLSILDQNNLGCSKSIEIGIND